MVCVLHGSQKSYDRVDGETLKYMWMMWRTYFWRINIIQEVITQQPANQPSILPHITPPSTPSCWGIGPEAPIPQDPHPVQRHQILSCQGHADHWCLAALQAPTSHLGNPGSPLGVRGTRPQGQHIKRGQRGWEAKAQGCQRLDGLFDGCLIFLSYLYVYPVMSSISLAPCLVASHTSIYFSQFLQSFFSQGFCY